MKTTEFNDSQRKRFSNKVTVCETGCWIYRCSPKNGYGQLMLNGKAGLYAHRVSYAMFNGDVPDGMMVRHTCDVRSCVNPKHLILGTNADNMQDVRDRGTDKVVTGGGEEHYNAKLTDALVVRIRKEIRSGKSAGEVSREMGFSVSTVWRAARGITWSHVPDALTPEEISTTGDRHWSRAS